MLFATQAATEIAKARTYRDEQRARADLEAVIDTSPVGVVVFDARSGTVVSINQEARRIVDGLRMPGRSPEEFTGGGHLPTCVLRLPCSPGAGAGCFFLVIRSANC